MKLNDKSVCCVVCEKWRSCNLTTIFPLEKIICGHVSSGRGGQSKTSLFFSHRRFSSSRLFTIMNYFLLCVHKRRRSWIIIFSTCFTFLLEIFITFNCILLSFFFFGNLSIFHIRRRVSQPMSRTLCSSVDDFVFRVLLFLSFEGTWHAHHFSSISWKFWLQCILFKFRLSKKFTYGFFFSFV